LHHRQIALAGGIYKSVEAGRSGNCFDPRTHGQSQEGESGSMRNLHDSLAALWKSRPV